MQKIIKYILCIPIILALCFVWFYSWILCLWDLDTKYAEETDKYISNFIDFIT